MKKVILIFIMGLFIFCNNIPEPIIVAEKPKESKLLRDNLPSNHFLFYPNGDTILTPYTDANSFGSITKWGRHLGADINKPGDKELGDTIYSIGSGAIITADGALIAILHRLKGNEYIISSYYHCDTLFISRNDLYVSRREPIGLMGKRYAQTAHLHFEIIKDTTRTNGFYDEPDTGIDFSAWVDPIKFIKEYNKNCNFKQDILNYK
jgi:murein DD-endopeptidase MepM/ murein hydrolase activator NlpD